MEVVGRVKIFLETYNLLFQTFLLKRPRMILRLLNTGTGFGSSFKYRDFQADESLR
jgi:hypothetical protein